ncbi:MAG: Gfo/Idh/MocA family oxidoreductase, partial [Bacteroidales bacterium]|nr:Gfo/Idh/MocA family oxidoreductase [Bacteroidales bacterium]
KVRNDFNIPNKTHDYQDILKDPAVEVVLIATPPDTHRDMFFEALRAGSPGNCKKTYGNNIFNK